MATIAQVKKDRQAQLNKLLQAMKTFDAKQESMERLIIRYRSKKKILEANDYAALNTSFREMNGLFSSIERELTNLAKVITAI